MKRVLWISSIIMLVLTLGFSCLNPQAVLAQSTQDVLRLRTSSPGSIDPSLASYVHEAQIVNQLFAGLLKTDAASGAVLPDLAESWSWNTEKTEITLSLRPGLVWSDGEPLTAEDARYGLLRSLAPETAGDYASILFPIVNAENYFNGLVTADEVGIFVDSPVVLRIQLNAPNVFFEKVLSLWVAAPTPAQVIELHPDDWTQPANIAVSGPYTLTEWTDSSMRLETNPNYYGSAPDIYQVDFILTADEQVAWNQYLLDNSDTTHGTATNMAQVLADPVLSQELHIYAGACTYYLAFQTDISPFGNANVRKALIAAVDRQDFVDNFMGGFGLATQTFTPPGLFGYVDGAALGIGIPSDAAQAQAYLSDAGYPNGQDFPAVTVQVADTSRNRASWDYMANAWQTILNVPITIEYVTPPAPYGQPILLVGWCADYNDAYSFLGDGVTYNRNTGRIGGWQNPAYDALLEQMVIENIPANRIPLYQQAEQILVEDDAVLGPLYNTINLVLTKPYLQRTYAAVGLDPINTWQIETEEDATYDPANTLEFDPTVDTTSYNLPAGVFAETVQLIHTTLRAEDIPAVAGLGGIGHAFTLDAVALPPVKALQPDETLLPYTVTIGYTPEQLVPQGINSEESLMLFALVGDQWVVQPGSVDIETHTLTATTQQIGTIFVVWGINLDFIYLPTLMR